MTDKVKSNIYKSGKSTTKVISGSINYIIITIIVLLFIFSAYVLWDTNQVFRGANSKQYEIYKPSNEDTAGFEELKKINSDVFAWLTVYGTNIDYPVVQGKDNIEYLSKDVMKNYSLTGTIYLNKENKKDFSDFNNIIFGHHMEQTLMFGSIVLFKDKEFFDSRKYGNLFYGGRDYGIEIFAFVKTEASNDDIYNLVPDIYKYKQKYIDDVYKLSEHIRPIGVSISDRLILLSTCTFETTNGRHILVGRITDNTFEDTFPKESDDGISGAGTDALSGFLFILGLSPIIWILSLLLLLIILTVLNIILSKRRKKRIAKAKEEIANHKLKIEDKRA